MVFVPGGMAALAILILLTLVPFKIGALKNAGKLSNFIIHTRGGGGGGGVVHLFRYATGDCSMQNVDTHSLFSFLFIFCLFNDFYNVRYIYNDIL